MVLVCTPGSAISTDVTYNIIISARFDLFFSSNIRLRNSFCFKDKIPLSVRFHLTYRSRLTTTRLFLLVKRDGTTLSSETLSGESDEFFTW